jgi:hypothetical protein
VRGQIAHRMGRQKESEAQVMETFARYPHFAPASTIFWFASLPLRTCLVWSKSRSSTLMWSLGKGPAAPICVARRSRARLPVPQGRRGERGSAQVSKKPRGRSVDGDPLDVEERLEVLELCVQCALIVLHVHVSVAAAAQAHRGQHLQMSSGGLITDILWLHGMLHTQVRGTVGGSDNVGHAFKHRTSP